MLGMQEGRKSAELANLFNELHGDTTSLGAVLEIGRDVEGLATHPGWAHVETLLVALKERTMTGLMRGTKPKEATEYAQQLGFLNGVHTALDAVATIQHEADRVRRALEKDIESQETAR